MSAWGRERPPRIFDCQTVRAGKAPQRIETANALRLQAGPACALRSPHVPPYGVTMMKNASAVGTLFSKGRTAASASPRLQRRRRSTGSESRLSVWRPSSGRSQPGRRGTADPHLRLGTRSPRIVPCGRVRFALAGRLGFTRRPWGTDPLSGYSRRTPGPAPTLRSPGSSCVDPRDPERASVGGSRATRCSSFPPGRRRPGSRA